MGLESYLHLHCHKKSQDILILPVLTANNSHSNKANVKKDIGQLEELANSKFVIWFLGSKK